MRSPRRLRVWRAKSKTKGRPGCSATERGTAGEWRKSAGVQAEVARHTIDVGDTADRRLAVTAGAAAKDRRADHPETYTAVALARKRGGAGRARLRARSRTNCAASALQRTPTSMPRTTQRRRAARKTLGYVRSMARRARRSATPAVERW